jgi:hypothetical protein
VLLRGGRRGAEPCVGVEEEAGGDGVGETIASSLDCMLGGRDNRSAKVGLDSKRGRRYRGSNRADTSVYLGS